MFCKYCGANIPDGARFCSSCGATASGSEERVEPTKAKKPDHIKGKPGDYTYNKGADYYSSENTIMNHDSYASDIYTKENRNNYVQKEVKYAEKFDFNSFNDYKNNTNSNITSVNDVMGVKADKPLGIFAKIGVTVAGLAIGCGIGYLIGCLVL